MGKLHTSKSEPRERITAIQHLLASISAAQYALQILAPEYGDIGSGKLYDDSDPNEGRDLHALSMEFNSGNGASPFDNAGIAHRGFYWSVNAIPQRPSHVVTLGEILQPESVVPSEFHVSRDKIKRWKEVKGAKRIWKKSRKSGVRYLYAEGPIAFPDATTNAARTIVTSEGGKTAARMKHIIKRRGRYRRLTPIELERLNGFPDNHTAVIPMLDTRRAFLMGNALVVGCVARIGAEIANNEGWNARVKEPNKTIRKRMARRVA